MKQRNDPKLGEPTNSGRPSTPVGEPWWGTPKNSRPRPNCEYQYGSTNFRRALATSTKTFDVSLDMRVASDSCSATSWRHRGLRTLLVSLSDSNSQIAASRSLPRLTNPLHKETRSTCANPVAATRSRVGNASYDWRDLRVRKNPQRRRDHIS